MKLNPSISCNFLCKLFWPFSVFLQLSSLSLESYIYLAYDYVLYCSRSRIHNDADDKQQRLDEKTAHICRSIILDDNKHGMKRKIISLKIWRAEPVANITQQIDMLICSHTGQKTFTTIHIEVTLIPCYGSEKSL